MKYVHMSYWPSVKSGWLDIGRVLFLHLKTQKKNEANIQPPRPNRLGQESLQSLDLVNKGLTILKKYFALIKIKNDLFILRAEKVSHRVCDTINPRGSFDFFLFWLLLPLLATSLLTLSNSYKLCKSASRTFFLARDITVQIAFSWGEKYIVHIHILMKIFEGLKVIPF